MTEPTFTITHRSVLKLAVPVMISNLSTPLLGVVDTAVVGRIPDPAHIGAVAVGALIFSFVFWAFGFLRMGTTGLTAQALGAGQPDQVGAELSRSLLFALVAGGALVILQWPLRLAAFGLLDGSPAVEGLARGYFDIRIWAAPATLANYALLGWFIGLGRTDIGLVLQLVLNIANIVLDLMFVVGLGMGVRGVAAGTVIAECLAVTVGLVIAFRFARQAGYPVGVRRALEMQRLRRMVTVNADIMLRSLALIAMFAWFVSRGAAQGDVILAANAVLMQFISFSAFFLDGLAFAAEALVGRALGARDQRLFRRAVGVTTLWSALLAVALSLAFVIAAPRWIDILTIDTAVRETARTFSLWAAAVPLLGVWAFQLDGIFIGATRTVAMRNAMLIALAIYLMAWWILTPWGNHGLWVAFLVSYFARAGTLLYCYRALDRDVPGPKTN
ncbi:MAG: MATE family efflux transporter [Gammaproteobacteria bacterium]|nr:MATE family efflux transporter [Gammaproteobacteria bacterium]